MPHLTRILWLLAWCVWLWLGFGLARELPRNPGAVIGTLTLEKNEYLCGDLDDRVAVSRLTDDAKESIRYRTWDVASGSLIHDWKGPVDGFGARELLRLGVVVGINAEAYESKTEVKPLQLLDLRTGAWTRLGSTFLQVLHEHPSKPWLVVEDASGGGLAVQVFDVEAKRWVFEWRRPQPKHVSDEELGEVWFDGDELCIVFQIPHRDKDGRSFYWWLKWQRLERWHIPTKTLIESLAIDPPGLVVAPPGPSGRMLLAGRNGSRKSIAVVDARTLKTVFSSEDLGEGETSWEENPSRPRIPTQRLSASGRTILSHHGRLWSVEQNRVLWRRRPETETVLSHDLSPTAFAVHESWTPLFQKLHLPFKLATCAVRDMETGAVHYRTFDASVEWWQILFAKSEPSENGAIRSQPPRVNWPLLALCQSILALPIMLLWSALKWRARRAARREPAVALHSMVPT